MLRRNVCSLPGMHAALMQLVVVTESSLPPLSYVVLSGSSDVCKNVLMKRNRTPEPYAKFRTVPGVFGFFLRPRTELST